MLNGSIGAKLLISVVILIGGQPSRLAPQVCFNTAAMISEARSIVFTIIPTTLLQLLAEAGLRLYELEHWQCCNARNLGYWGFVQDRLLRYRPSPIRKLRIILPGGNQLDANAQGFEMLIYLSNPSGKGDLLSTWESPANGTGSSNRTTMWPHRRDTFCSGAINDS